MPTHCGHLRYKLHPALRVLYPCIGVSLRACAHASLPLPLTVFVPVPVPVPLVL